MMCLFGEMTLWQTNTVNRTLLKGTVGLIVLNTWNNECMKWQLHNMPFHDIHMWQLEKLHPTTS